MSWCFSLNRPMSVLTRLEHLPYPRPDALPFQPLPACPSCQAAPPLSSQRSDKALAECNFTSVHKSYPDSYLAAFTLYGRSLVRTVRPLRPYHPYQPIPPLNSLLSLCSQLLCVFTSNVSTHLNTPPQA